MEQRALGLAGLVIAVAALGLGLAALILALDDDEPNLPRGVVNVGRFDPRPSDDRAPLAPFRERFEAPQRRPPDLLPALQRARLGVAVEPTDAGLLVTAVADGSPAAEAGIQSGDLLIALDGQPLESIERAAELVAAVEAGETAELEFERDGERRQVEIEPRAVAASILPRIFGDPSEFDVQVVSGELAALDGTKVVVATPDGRHSFERTDATRIFPADRALASGDPVVVIAAGGIARVIWGTPPATDANLT